MRLQICWVMCLAVHFDINDRVQSASYKNKHDEAYAKAMNEVMPDFIQCPKCLEWVCKKKCWNHKKNLCLDCVEEAKENSSE